MPTNTPEPPTKPPPDIDIDNEEENLKYCGSVVWQFYRPPNSDNGKCLYFTPNEKEFNEQQQVCQSMDGALIAINSPTENKYILNKLSTTQVKYSLTKSSLRYH